MKTSRGIVLVLAAALFALLAAAALLLNMDGGTLGAQEAPAKPTFVPARDLTPAPTPGDAREFAVLDIVINSDDSGAVREARLERARIFSGYAPNVFALPPGDWTIELDGEKPMQFGVLDPRAAEAEVEGAEGDKAPYTYELTMQFTWELVVPLYDGREDLGVKTIRILDVAGKEFFSVEVNRDEWRRAGQAQ